MSVYIDLSTDDSEENDMEEDIDDTLELFLVAYVLDKSEHRMGTKLTEYDDPYRGNEYTVR
jgi:hypothetical protein